MIKFFVIVYRNLSIFLKIFRLKQVFVPILFKILIYKFKQVPYITIVSVCPAVLSIYCHSSVITYQEFVDLKISCRGDQCHYLQVYFVLLVLSFFK